MRDCFLQNLLTFEKENWRVKLFFFLVNVSGSIFKQVSGNLHDEAFDLLIFPRSYLTSL
jgi:hypothetical protein